MKNSFFCVASLCGVLLLTACGDGWEAQKTDTYFPYGNQRTAGSGVVYVRAKMLPEKELKVEPVIEEAKPEEPPAPVLEANEIFSEVQGKGSAVHAAKPAPVVDAPLTSAPPPPDADTPAHSEPAVEAVPEKHSFNTMGRSIGLQSMQERIASQTSGLSAEDYIAQAPKQIEVPDVIVTDIEPASGMVDEEFDPVIEMYEETVVQPVAEIVSPKKDFFGFMDEGQKNLDEIYSDPF